MALQKDTLTSSVALRAAIPDLDRTDATENGFEEKESLLAVAAQKGDKDAFQELYEAYGERLRTLALYWIGDPVQAQDIVQTVFLKVFRGIPRFKHRSRLFTWIYRIARNECRNHLRRNNGRQVPLEEILGRRDEIDPRPSSNGGDPHGDILRNAVMQLPFKMREVVALKYVEGLSYKEMSRVLGCAAGTVASRLNRALAELEERLRPFRRFL